MGEANIPLKLLKMSTETIVKPPTNLINSTMLDNFIFLRVEKKAQETVTHALKKEDKHIKSNYLPISILNFFSKIFERFLLNQMLPFIDNMMSFFLSAYRSRYSKQHVLLKLIEDWRVCLGENKVIGGIHMDLSQSLPNGLLIAKHEAYGLSSNLLLLHAYVSQKIVKVWWSLGNSKLVSAHKVRCATGVNPGGKVKCV